MLRKKKRAIFRYLAGGILAALSFSVVSAGAVYAYLKWQSPRMDNSFRAEESAVPLILEEFDHREKSNVRVRIEDQGYSVYVRASIVVTWMNTKGEVLSVIPATGRDYVLEIADDGWFAGNDGFYYYKTPVEGTQMTGVLIKNCRPLEEAPKEGYALDVKIAVQTIQAAGTTDDRDVPAVTDAWGVAAGEDGSVSEI